MCSELKLSERCCEQVAVSVKLPASYVGTELGATRLGKNSPFRRSGFAVLINRPWNRYLELTVLGEWHDPTNGNEH